ncbi:beta-1,4 N-acetylgalactosaminyltransferase 1-like [Glandiceps talaboti]
MRLISALSAVLYFSLGVVLTTMIFLNSTTFMFLNANDGLINDIVQIIGERQWREIMKTRFLNSFNGDIYLSREDGLGINSRAWSYRSSEYITEENLRRNMSLQQKPCRCMKRQPFPLDKEMDERRRTEATRWKRHQAELREPLAICKSMSPLSYVGSGIVVEPLQPVRLVGLKINQDFVNFFTENDIPEYILQIKLSKEVSKLVVHSTALSCSTYFNIIGNGTKYLILKSKSVETLNCLLKHVIYKSMIYDIDIRDTAEINFMGFTIQVHVHVRREILPDLYDSGREGVLSDKVTVITKTFERYDAVNRLVESLNEFYPNLTIVIADDSEEPQRVMGKNVKQTIMPFAEGLFAGRGVALSQVTTKYFVWVDDDFIFSEKTKLEYMLEKLEDSIANLDLVGGTVNGSSYNKCFIFKNGGQTGDCLRTLHGRYHRVERFPECDIVDVVVDFFMAKTSVVRKIGFDPEYRRIGHTAFFVDGLGKMRVAMCKDVDIDHVPIRNKKYLMYRARLVDKNDPKRHAQHFFFNNNLKCI